VGAVRDYDDFTDHSVERIAAYDLFGLAFSLEANRNIRFDLGVNNLFDKNPPIMGDNAGFDGGNTWPGTYDVLGRSFFVAADFGF
jgi:outer membrane receptor for ferrienterochelin and colicin